MLNVSPDALITSAVPVAATRRTPRDSKRSLQTSKDPPAILIYRPNHFQKCVPMNHQDRLIGTSLPPASGPVSNKKSADLYRRGQAHLDAGQHFEALQCYLRIAKIIPNSWDAAFRCGVLLFELQRYEEALSFLDRCQKLRSEHGPTFYMRARTLRMMRRFEEAIVVSEQAEVLAPNDPDVFNNTGIILHCLCRDKDAVDRFDRAILLRPQFFDAINNKANALVQLQRFTEALSCYSAAKSLAPDDTTIDWNVAYLRMVTGDFAAGWVGRESRWTKKAAPVPYPKLPTPMWLGQESVAGKTILVYADEGLGDTIQFARYLPLLAAHGARVVLVADEALHCLMSRLPGVALFVPKSDGATVPRFDLHCALSSLPLAFCTRLDTIPSARAYFPPVAAEKRQAWEARLGDRHGMRIGLAWSGNQRHVNDHNRSVPLNMMARLVTGDAQFISLQKDPRPADRTVLRERSDIADHTSHMSDFSATAALISCLDLVITVDTSVAHLAAAFGRPTWVPLPYTPDYRWLLDRDDSPWYPTVRLFRQDETRDYETVIDRVHAELAKQIRSIGSAPLDQPHEVRR
jgi:tetratricopeptide (TPR) repeat protein